MTLQELRDKADAKLVQFWQLLQTKQDAYFAKHGKYFQLLISPESPVLDGVDSDFSVRLVEENTYTADVNFSWSDKIPFQIEVDAQTDGTNHSYLASVVVVYNGQAYKRTRTSGNEDSGWFKIPFPLVTKDETAEVSYT